MSTQAEEANLKKQMAAKFAKQTPEATAEEVWVLIDKAVQAGFQAAEKMVKAKQLELLAQILK